MTTSTAHQRQEINIAIIGPVSAGKSTFMNSLFVSQFSDMKIKRTTMVPQLYMESDETGIDIAIMNSIKEQNTAINNAIIAKSEANEAITLADIQECRYLVPKVHKLVELVDNTYLTVYDIPGLNDARTKEVFYEYIHSNFHNFDLIIFVIDINSALNTSDEIDMLNMILNNCKENRDKYGIANKMIVLLNKCDELYLNDAGEVCLDDEYTEMYEQAKVMIKQKVDEIIPELGYKVLPISCEDSYIYRMYDRNPDFDLDVKHVNKFGINEFGKKPWNRFNEATKKQKIRTLMQDMDLNDTLKLTGFNGFRKAIKHYLNVGCQFKFLLNHINYERNSINAEDENSVDALITVYKKDAELCKMFEKKFIVSSNTKDYFYEYFIEYKRNVDKLISDVNDENIEEVIKHRNIITRYVEVMSEISQCIELLGEINEAIEAYYLANIKKNEKTLSALFDFIKNLFSGFTSKKNDLTVGDMIALFSNNAEMVKVTNGHTIKRLEYLEREGCITSADKINILKSVLVKRYQNVFNSVEFVANGGCTSKYIYTAMMFWNREVQGSFDMFKTELFDLAYWSNIAFKNMLEVSYDSGFNVDDALELERYLMSAISV